MIDKRPPGVDSSGLVSREDVITIKIPPGVTDGKTIRLAGQGQPGGKGAPDGDLLIELHERPHARFRRREPGGADIEVELPIPVDTSILWGKADVGTL